MPWCPTCDRFLSPPTVTSDGRCPKCGRPVEPGRARAGEPGDRSADRQPDMPGEEELGPVPFHLKFLGVALVIYLGWRFLQGVEWVIHRF